MTCDRIVLKIGGATLFSKQPWRSLVEGIRDRERGSQRFWILGGGETVESMRTLQALYPGLDRTAMHWRCVRLLDATWEVGCELLTDFQPIPDKKMLESAAADRQPGDHLVRVEAFYNRNRESNLPIRWRPHADWGTTTDALAWLLAKQIEASRVCLFKRCSCDPNLSIEAAEKIGIVDPEIARLASQDPDCEALRFEWIPC
jgi:hypothetical protein